MAEFRFQLLGPVRAWRDGVEVPVGAPQQQAVLAVLLLARGAHVSLPAMVDALWGPNPPKTSTGTLRTYISRLRQLLGDGMPAAGLVIDGSGEGYALYAERMTVDLDVFEARIAEANQLSDKDAERVAALCHEALELWRSTPLAGVQGFFAEAVRTRTIELRADAVQIESAALIESGDHLAAIARLRKLIVELPLREGLHELLMLALHREGRRADALEVYANAQRILSEELGVEPGISLRQMHQRVLRSDESDARRAGLRLTVGGGRVVPGVGAGRADREGGVDSRLPASSRNFVGRAELRAALVETLGGDDSGSRIAVLRGMPGVGKSALAIRAGHDLARQFPDGQVLVEVGAAEAPMRPEDVLVAALRAVGGSGYPVVERSSRTLGPEWRELIAGRRLLVVLDDVDSVEQIRAVVAAPTGCGFILTSRRTLMDLENAVNYEVPVLDDAAMLVLLERLIGAERVAAEPQAAAALVRSCAGLPSTLRTVAARLASRPHWSLGTALQHLDETLRSGSSEDGQSVVRVLSSAIRGLSSEQKHLLRGAAQFDESWIHVAPAAEAIGLPEHTVREGFEHLADLHLLRPGAWDAYGLEPAVRTLVRQLCASA